MSRQNNRKEIKAIKESKKAACKLLKLIILIIVCMKNPGGLMWGWGSNSSKPLTLFHYRSLFSCVFSPTPSQWTTPSCRRYRWTSSWWSGNQRHSSRSLLQQQQQQVTTTKASHVWRLIHTTLATQRPLRLFSHSGWQVFPFKVVFFFPFCAKIFF